MNLQSIKTAKYFYGSSIFKICKKYNLDSNINNKIIMFIIILENGSREKKRIKKELQYNLPYEIRINIQKESHLSALNYQYNNPEKIYLCPVCDKKFTKPYTMYMYCEYSYNHICSCNLMYLNAIRNKHDEYYESNKYLTNLSDQESSHNYIKHFHKKTNGGEYFCMNCDCLCIDTRKIPIQEIYAILRDNPTYCWCNKDYYEDEAERFSYDYSMSESNNNIYSIITWDEDFDEESYLDILNL